MTPQPQASKRRTRRSPARESGLIGSGLRPGDMPCWMRGVAPHPLHSKPKPSLRPCCSPPTASRGRCPPGLLGQADRR